MPARWDGGYRFVADRSKVQLLSFAPGHNFRAVAMGIAGEARVEDGQLVELSARCPLAALDAGDALKNHELRRFLTLDRRPIAELSLLSKVVLLARGDRLAGKAEARLSIGARALTTWVTFEGSATNVRAELEASFTGFGYDPPKLLFFKVKDRLELTVEVVLEKC